MKKKFRRSTLIEWVILSLSLLVSSVVIFTVDGASRIDNAIYDIASHQLISPPTKDVVIIKIDDDSIRTLGKWPWPREIYATVLDKLTQAPAAAVGLDIILDRPDLVNPDGDLQLATAIQKNGRTVLPVIADLRSNPPLITYPVTFFHANIGHINIPIDSDGIVRSVYLKIPEEGQSIDHFSLSMLRVGHYYFQRSAAKRKSVFDGDSDFNAEKSKINIAFTNRNSPFKQYSFVDVARGSVSPGFFKDKYVFIGVTATGLSDVFSTSSITDSRRTGVELLADILQTVRFDLSIEKVPPLFGAALTAVITMVACSVMLTSSARGALLATVLVPLLTICVSAALIVTTHHWFAPSSAIICCCAAYPLWSWRRQETALKYMRSALEVLDREPSPLEPAQTAITNTDTLDSCIDAVEKAVERTKTLRTFLTDSLNNLPDATAVCNSEGSVVLANPGGHAVLSCPLLLFEQSGKRFDIQDLFFKSKTPASGSTGSKGEHLNKFSDVNLITPEGSHLLVKIGVLKTSLGEVAAYVVSFVDITSIRKAERAREETMRFISHDLKSPITSMMALAEIYKSSGNDLTASELCKRLEMYGRRALSMADSFIQLTRAETATAATFSLVDPKELVIDAVDELWTIAHKANIELRVNTEQCSALIKVDRALVTRAIINLLNNSIKYSKSGTHIDVIAISSNLYVDISVIDQGPGIDMADQCRIFEPFERGSTSTNISGSGLGLAFVRTVATKHEGQVRVTSTVGVGSNFTLTLPSQPICRSLCDFT